MGDMRDEVILHAAGFAKVKPLDKHLVVDTFQKKGMVVGMTGDGVNDAPALAKAQIGIAVHGATDAAKSAGDIVLTRDGLSPILTAIQISRRIFKRLKSYVIYRICITVQVVFFLACLALCFDLRFKALYIILLALFHDLQCDNCVRPPSRREEARNPNSAWLDPPKLRNGYLDVCSDDHAGHAGPSLPYCVQR